MGSLTDRDCKALVERARKAADARQPGAPPVTLDASDGNNLLLRAGARGATWTLRWVVDGKVRGQSLGKYPAMGLAAARRAAQEAMVRVRAGLEPLPPPPVSAASAAPLSPPAGPTVKDVLDTYMARHVRLEARDPDQVQWVCDALLSELHNRPTADLSRKALTGFLDDVADKRGSASAYRAGAVLRAAFRFCVRRGDLETDPTHLLALPSSGKARDTTLSDAELAAVWHSNVPVWSRLVRVLLLTGLRLREAADAPVSELQGDLWTIPAVRMKGGRAHVVPLDPRLVGELGDLAGKTWLFKSPRRFDQPIKGFSRGLELVQREASTSNEWTLHDLRRTAATGLQRLGCPHEVVEAILAHRRPGVSAVYQRHDYVAERREWLTRWAAWLDALPKPAA